MEADVEKVTSQLIALKQLYGLIQVDPITVHLDDMARAFLKDLLDQASEKLLKTYTQIITYKVNTRVASSMASPNATESVQVAGNYHLVSPPHSAFDRTISKQNGGINSREALSIPSSVYPQSCMPQPQIECRTTGDDFPQGLSPLKPPRHEKTYATFSRFTNSECRDRATCLRIDIAHSIKRIEAQVLVLRHLPCLANDADGQITHHQKIDLSSTWREDIITTGKMAGRTENPEMPSPCMDQVRVPNGRASRDLVHGYRVSQDTCDMHMSTGQRDYAESDAKFVQRRPRFPSQDGISLTSVGSNNWKLMKEKNSIGNVDIHRPALTEQRSRRRMSSHEVNKSRSRQVGSHMPIDRNLEHRVESDTSSSGSQDSSPYSSSRTSSQQTSTSSRYSSDDSSRSLYTYSTGIRESESGDSTSRSYSSCSVPSQQGHKEQALKVFSPRRRSRSRHPGSAIGKLRKIKNKLGLIFHHHHHHHHHHHENEELRVHGKSKWTNVLHGPIVEKSRKAVERKSQGGHFHALVEGLMKHVRNKKKKKDKPKPPDITGLKRNKNKKKRRKLHWWQMTRQRARGRRTKLKLPNKRL